MPEVIPTKPVPVESLEQVRVLRTLVSLVFLDCVLQFRRRRNPTNFYLMGGGTVLSVSFASVANSHHSISLLPDEPVQFFRSGNRLFACVSIFAGFRPGCSPVLSGGRAGSLLRCSTRSLLLWLPGAATGLTGNRFTTREASHHSLPCLLPIQFRHLAVGILYCGWDQRSA